MAIIKGSMRRGLEGAGGALEKSGLLMVESTLNEQRQTRLQELQNAHAEKMETGRREFQTSERVAGQAFTSRENLEGREHAAGLQSTALEASAREHRENRAVQREGQAIQGRQVSVLEQGANLDQQIKQIALDNAKQVEKLRTEFATASLDRKRAIEEHIQILTGKDNDIFLPVPIKDDIGNIVGYEIFDKKRGAWVDAPRRGATANPLGLNLKPKPPTKPMSGPDIHAQPVAGPAGAAGGAATTAPGRERLPAWATRPTKYGPLTPDATLEQGVNAGNPEAIREKERRNRPAEDIAGFGNIQAP